MTVMPKKKGQKGITFKKGGEHRSTHTPAGETISASKHMEAKAGKFGKKAEKQEIFRENVLTGRKGKKSKSKKKKGGGKK